MAAVAFDSLQYAHQLEAAGMPRAQVEVVAKGLTTMFIHNFESLVTKDYLDTRFTEFETRVEANMDKRFVEIDRRFVELETNMDRRFVEVETNMDRRFDGLELRFERIDSKFSKIYLMFGLTMATATIPILQNLYS